jgi:hypothetical protein
MGHGGELVVDNIYLTNSCGQCQFVNNGGTLVVNGRIFALAPVLSAARSPGMVTVSWQPASAPWPDWSLQTNSDLTKPNGWVADGVLPTSDDGINSVSVPPSAARLFFRLIPIHR